METKKCSKCGCEKPISEFYAQKGHKHGVMSLCKECFNHFCVTRWIKRKIEYIKYMGGECQHCHIKLDDTNYSIFDFHHVDPSTKELDWTKLRLLSDTKIKSELSKCILLCANCHRLAHSNE